MSFYLKPPRGLINLHTFQSCIEQRLNCYDSISNKEIEIANFDCLIEDSPLDRTGHYLFRLFAYCSTSFQHVFLKNEQLLLLLRLNSYSKGDVRYFLKRMLKHTKECLYDDNTSLTLKKVYISFLNLFSHMLRIDCMNHLFTDIHEVFECEKFMLKVPFYLCTSLVSCRKVTLKKGYAEIKCSQWKKMLLSIYETYLKTAMKEMKYSQSVHLAINDVRIREVFKIIRNHCFENIINVDIDRKRFDITRMDEESQLFPLCMLNMYKVLQMTNRLSHNDRYDFSLFLKDIGISLTDSIQFWENSYTKQHRSCSKCSHNWKDNEKRYIYGIRHLYGLEGSRRNYAVRSCNFFQGKVLSAREDGGCPFKHFDDDNLRQVLKKLLPNKADDIEVMIYERRESPSESCKLFYNIILEEATSTSTTVEDDSFSNPAQYYLSLKRKICKNSATNSVTDSGIVV